MATNFPTSLDSLTNPTATDTLDSPPHDTQHADANDAIEAIQAKVGIDSSAVTTSLDYRVGQLELGGGSMTTSSTAPSSPSDGDMWYDTDDGRTYVYYDDGTSQQWVEFGAPPVQHGKILQVVSTIKTDTFSASVAAGATTTVTGLSASLTCSDAANKVFVVVNLGMVGNGQQLGNVDALVQAAGSSILVGAAAGNRSQVHASSYTSSTGTTAVTQNLTIMGLHSPASTSAISYTVDLRNYASSTQTLYLNRSPSDLDSAVYARGAATITLFEVSA